MSEAPPKRLLAAEPAGFFPGATLDIANGGFRGIGFGGRATVAKLDANHFELDLRVSKLLFHIEVKLKFELDARGQVQFFGGRPDGKATGSEPAHVKHTMTIVSQTPERTVLEFPFEDGKNGTVIRQVVLEKARVKGAEGLRLTYDRFELTLVPRR